MDLPGWSRSSGLRVATIVAGSLLAAAAWAQSQPKFPTPRPAPKAPAPAVALEPVPLAARSRLGAKLAEGRFVTTVEIVPPKGVDPSPMFEQVRQLKAAGVDAVNVPDGPRAQSRMGALLSAVMIEREVGLEAVVHYACRDRNLLGMLSDLLGASAAGALGRPDRSSAWYSLDRPSWSPAPASRSVRSRYVSSALSPLSHSISSSRKRRTTRPSFNTATASITTSAMAPSAPCTRTPDRHVRMVTSGTMVLPRNWAASSSCNTEGGWPGPPATSNSRRPLIAGNLSCHRLVRRSTRRRSVIRAKARRWSGVS